MDEAAHDHKTLNALNEQIAAEQTRIADLQRRIRVIDLEVAAWKFPPPPPQPSADGFFSGVFVFFATFSVVALLGRLIAQAIGP
jgi:hypothetical protein